MAYLRKQLCSQILYLQSIEFGLSQIKKKQSNTFKCYFKVCMMIILILETD